MNNTIVVFSTKGGVGKTLLATNLSIYLARHAQQKVLLLDLDFLAAGEINQMLNIKASKTVLDLGAMLEKESPEKINIADIVTPLNFGIDFLSGVVKAHQISEITPHLITKAVSFLKRHYGYIIIDGGDVFSEQLVSSFSQANLILGVITPDISAVYHMRWFLDIFQSMGFPLKMMKIVLNRAKAQGAISKVEVEAVLPCNIIETVPSEGKSVGEALNRQLPVAVDSPRSRVSQAIERLSRELVVNPDLFTPNIAVEEKDLEKTGVRLTGKLPIKKEAQGPGLEKEKPDEIIELKRRVHERLLRDLDLKRMDLGIIKDALRAKELRDKTEKIITNAIVSEAGAFLSDTKLRQRLIKEITDEALGLGPLEDLLLDQEISDIMVNNKDQIYIEKHGKIELTDKRFISDDQVRQIIERIIAPLGRRIDESVPMVDARLADGSRVNAVIPPLSLTGPTLTIRKFKKEIYEVGGLINVNTLNPAMAEFLNACVLVRKNIIVSGGTGSGKTTVLNALSSFIVQEERIVTIEDAAELRLHQEHWVRLESRAANIEGKGAVSIRDLFRNTLRMRPDRIIIGECRGAETLDMLQAMNTGHDGSMTTIHANSTHDVLARIDSMILLAGIELPLRAIREMVASAVDVVIHTARLSDGTRKILQITEVAGMKDEEHVNLQDIFVFKQTGVNSHSNVVGEFHATGYTPSFYQDIKVRGINLPENIFNPS